MLTDKAKAATEYRKLAAQCAEIAGRMPIEADREHMLGMAQRWLDIAKDAEGHLAAPV